MADIENTYRVNGKEISVVNCTNSNRKGRKGIYLNGKVYVLNNNDDASERKVNEIGANPDEWAKRSFDIHNGLWNTMIAQWVINLFPFL